MIETTKQQSSSTVQDPVCGMTIDPDQAFATRTFGGETFYFCSERCVGQFDQQHTGSATTGVDGTQRLLRVELPVTNRNGRHGAARLQEHLETMPGVAQATANPKTNLLRVTYDPSEIALEAIVERVRELGYTVGIATTQLDIQGMHCASCVVTIEEALQQTRGVLSATVNPATGQAHVVYLPGLVDRGGLTHAIEAADTTYVVKRLRPRQLWTALNRIGRMNMQHCSASSGSQPSSPCLSLCFPIHSSFLACVTGSRPAAWPCASSGAGWRSSRCQ